MGWESEIVERGRRREKRRRIWGKQEDIVLGFELARFQGWREREEGDWDWNRRCVSFGFFFEGKVVWSFIVYWSLLLAAT